MGDNLIDGHVLEHLREIEEAAEEVLSEKQEIVDLDRKRNQNREAIRALSRPQENSSNESYGNTGCRVFKRGVQNWKDFCLRINYPENIIEF